MLCLKNYGYKQSITQLGHLKYYKDDYNVYYFLLDRKGLWKSGEHDSMCDEITIPELKAINTKAKELGWETNYEKSIVK